MNTGEAIFIITLFTIVISVFLGFINRCLFGHLFEGWYKKTWFCTLFFFLMYVPGFNLLTLLLFICLYGINDLKNL